MLQFPCPIHPLDYFEVDGQIYVIDWSQGRLLWISRVLKEIINLCPQMNLYQLVAHLSQKYTEEEIFEELGKLEQFAKLGFLLDKQKQFTTPSLDKPLKLFVIDDVMYEVMYGSSVARNPMNVVNNPSLVSALAQYAEIHVGIPEQLIDDVEFKEPSISKVPLLTGRTHSPLQGLKGRYDGILALSPTYFDDLHCFGPNEIPVVSRVHSQESDQQKAINAIVAKATLMRSFDAIATDASWVESDLTQYLQMGCAGEFHFIPDGIDLSQFQPANKRLAKEAVKALLEIPSVEEKPIVGGILGGRFETHIQQGIALAKAWPDFFFLIYEPGMRSSLPLLPMNLRFFGAEQHTDKEYMGLMFNAMDVLFYVGIIGSPGSLLLSAMACEVPIVMMSFRPFADVEDALAFFPLEKRVGYEVELPLDRIGYFLEDFLKDSTSSKELAKRAYRKAQNFTWKRTAQTFVELFQHLNALKLLDSKTSLARYPVIFCQYYNQGLAQSQAIRLFSYTRASVEQGLIWDLRQAHTEAEIHTILAYIHEHRKSA